jgi:hypothetical protein
MKVNSGPGSRKIDALSTTLQFARSFFLSPVVFSSQIKRREGRISVPFAMISNLRIATPLLSPLHIQLTARLTPHVRIRPKRPVPPPGNRLHCRPSPSPRCPSPKSHVILTIPIAAILALLQIIEYPQTIFSVRYSAFRPSSNDKPSQAFQPQILTSEILGRQALTFDGEINPVIEDNDVRGPRIDEIVIDESCWTPRNLPEPTAGSPLYIYGGAMNRDG